MSVNRRPEHPVQARPLLLAGLALPAEHIALAKSPAVPIRALAEAAETTGRVIGRPYLIWKDDLDLAREVNERLAAGSPH
jgi:phosphatidylserine/phosphatidylglycerophosphate/cardiolipin synthase-like enzyme